MNRGYPLAGRDAVKAVCGERLVAQLPPDVTSAAGLKIVGPQEAGSTEQEQEQAVLPAPVPCPTLPAWAS